METVHLPSAITRMNCSKIFWCYPALDFSNEIQRLISSYDVVSVDCGKHNYMFAVRPNNTPSVIPREYVNTFIVFNCTGDRVYPEDIV